MWLVDVLRMTTGLRTAYNVTGGENYVKRLIISAAMTLILAGSAFALTDAEYNTLRKSNADFARADRNLTQVWKKIAGKMSGASFKRLQSEQRYWISEGRDDEAERYMEMGYSRAEAYTMATNDRAEYLSERAREIMRSK